MEAVVTVLGAVVVALVGWILYHSSRCTDFHERVARLEERMGMKKDDSR